jgi:hypothetical protein
MGWDGEREVEEENRVDREQEPRTIADTLLFLQAACELYMLPTSLFSF